MQGIVEIIHLIVDPVYRHRVLNQIIGANGQKIQMLRENVRAYRRGRHFHHPAHRDVLVEFQLLLPQFGLKLLDQIQHLLSFLHVRQHGDHESGRAVGGGSQNASQLRAKQRRLFQA